MLTTRLPLSILLGALASAATTTPAESLISTSCGDGRRTTPKVLMRLKARLTVSSVSPRKSAISVRVMGNLRMPDGERGQLAACRSNRNAATRSIAVRRPKA